MTVRKAGSWRKQMPGGRRGRRRLRDALSRCNPLLEKAHVWTPPTFRRPTWKEQGGLGSG